jgi:hypothetical protein
MWGDGDQSRQYRGSFMGSLKPGDWIEVQASRPRVPVDEETLSFSLESPSGGEPFMVIERQESIPFDCEVGLENFQGSFQSLGDRRPAFVTTAQKRLESVGNQTLWVLVDVNPSVAQACPASVSAPGRVHEEHSGDTCNLGYAGPGGAVQITVVPNAAWKFTIAYFHWGGDWRPQCQDLLFSGECFDP